MSYFFTNRIAAWMVSVGICVIGIISIVKLPIGLLPHVEYPSLSVIVEYPGISPEKIEHLITRPIERIIRTVAEIETIESFSEEGKSQLILTLHPNTDVKIVALKVREKIALIRDSFPRAVHEPIVLRYDPTERPILIAAVKRIPTQHATRTEIREFAEYAIKPRLQRIDGVSEIFIAGGAQKEIHVTIDPVKFFSRNLDFSEIVHALQRQHISIPAGTIFHGNTELRIRIPERFQNIEDISRVALRTYDGNKSIYLGDIARVEESFREAESTARYNGEEQVLIYLHKAADANALSVISEAGRILSHIDGCDIDIIYNQANCIRAALLNAVYSGLWGILIVIFVIMILYRDFYKVLIIALSIPLSLMFVCTSMYFAKIEINIITLAGIALAVGMVVDASILVMEKIETKTSLNEIKRSVHQIRVATATSTITNGAVFLPLVFADEITRRMYWGIGFTITAACIASLFVATSLLPAWYLSMKKAFRHAHRLPFRFNFEYQLEWLKKTYARALSRAFSVRKKVICTTAMVASISFMILWIIPKEFVNPFESDDIYLYCELPTGTPLWLADEATKKVEEKIKGLNVAEKISSKVEKWRGNIAITLKSFYFTRTRDECKKSLLREAQAAVAPYGGFAFLVEATENPQRELDIIFTGNDDAMLRHIARKASKTVEGIAGVEECLLRFRDDKPVYSIVIDREKSGNFGLSPIHLCHFFHGALFGPVAMKYYTGEREIDTRVKFDKKNIACIENIIFGMLPINLTRAVPLRELLSIKQGTEPTRLMRYNARRAVRITVRLGNISFDDAITKIAKALSSLHLPEDYGWEFDTSYEKSKKVFRSVLFLVGAALLLVYMVMAGVFESFLAPLLILATIPLGICGVALSFFLLGTPMTASSFIGIVILSGIAVNNGIVLVEQTLSAIRRCKKFIAPVVVDRLSHRTAVQHFRPLFATTMTTCLL
ncbi:MAG: efflux RND transporter permease subunit, partial [Spirochaetes bacterium]|nr:efflux RND transporter permease subunit [Spirochaetota bacterium]